jgi:hypothetical protein
LFVVFSVIPYFLLPGVIVNTMLIMYREVLAQEKKLRQFCIGVLELRKENMKKDNDRTIDNIISPAQNAENAGLRGGGTRRWLSKSEHGRIVISRHFMW